MSRYLPTALAHALLFALVACGKTSVPTPDAAVTSASPEVAAGPSSGVTATSSASDCTWETPLVAGVPGSPGHLIRSERNPNGHSELAWRMRSMQDHLAATRSSILEGRPLPARPTNHDRIRCSWPTTASDRNAAFDAFSVNYLQALDALHDPAAKAPVRERYGALLGTCRACHENTCPGPLMAIEALALEPAAAPAAAPAPAHP